MELISDSYGRFKLTPAETRSRKFFTIVLMAIVWNALTGFAIYAIATQWKGGMMYLVSVVLFIFALLGLMMIYSIFYQFIALFGPRATLTIGSNNLRFGGRIDLNWSFTMPQLVKKLEFWLDLDEDEKEAKSSDHGVCVYNAEDSSLSGSGQVSIQLPENSPKIYIQSRKISYVLKLKAKVKFLPDLDVDYPIEISA